MTERSDREWENLFISAAQRSRLTNKVPAHTHHHPGPGKNAHKEAECRAAVSNRFGFKWRCLTAGGVHVNVINLSPAESKIQFQPKPWAGFGGIIVTISRQ